MTALQCWVSEDRGYNHHLGSHISAGGEVVAGPTLNISEGQGGEGVSHKDNSILYAYRDLC